MKNGDPSKSDESKGRQRFRSFLEKSQTNGDLLPLVHTTSAYSFMDIAEGEFIKTKRCRHFDEELIYLFYGRPSYRTQNSINSSMGFNYPFVFIFKPEAISNIRAVYPFDTGAFFLKLYEKFFDKSSQSGDFELEPTMKSAEKVVSSFYSSNSNYMQGPSRKNVDIPITNFEARGVHELSRMPPFLSSEEEAIARDERSSSVEIQIGDPIDIREAILGIIVPSPFMNEDEVLEALRRWEVSTIRSYEIFDFHSPGSWIPQIYGEVVKMYTEFGFLDSDKNV